jgi:hypothetical protein
LCLCVPLLFLLLRYGEDRELGTKDLAEVAIDATRGLDRLGEVIPFDIEALGHGQDVAGAIRDAELAALAPLLDNHHPASGDPDLVLVKRFPPIFHPDSF